MSCVALDLPEAERTRDALLPRFQETNLLPVPWVEPVDISNAVLWLAYDRAAVHLARPSQGSPLRAVAAE
jgi:hypothetical protein